MKMITRTILGVILLAGTCFNTSYCFADANIGVSVFNIDTDIADFRGINLDVGYDFNDIFGVRASYMIGSEDEQISGVNVEIDEMYSIDAIVTFPLSDSLNPYITVGQLHADLKADYMGYSASASDDFTTYGAGIKFDLREAVTVAFEFKDVDGDAMTMLRLQANF